MAANNLTVRASGLFAFLLLSPAPQALLAGHASTDPLFADSSVIEFTIEAPFTDIMVERSNIEETPGTLRFKGDSGDDVSLDIGIRTRGEFRRQSRVCPFAPLRLNFRKSQTADSIFAHQDKLKLVTHCRDRSRHYEQTVPTEYLAYRFLNVLTDSSFRVRMVLLTYLDSDSGREVVKPAFLIEDEDRLAVRLGIPLIETGNIKVSDLDPEHTSLTSVFQYLIANTDFSPVHGREGDTCCHNHILLGNDDSPWLAVPYDFDMSGLVNAKHAAPGEQFRIRSVRQRVYRGRCAHSDYLPATLDEFRRARPAIEALIAEQFGMTDSARASAQRFVDGFYGIINDPDLIERALFKQCI